MRIATVNVNGIRAAARKGMGDWLAETAADVVLMQEVRAPEELVPDFLPGYQVAQQASRLKGRAGVAIGVREGLEIGRTAAGLSADEPDVDSGRWIEAEIPALDLTVVSAYLHSGVASDEQKMAAKYAHLEAVTRRLRQLRESGSNVVVAGDFNIVHTALDIKNWKSNHNKSAGVLDPEIAYLDRWLGELGWVDVQRTLVGEEQGPYTWWSQRGKAFDNDAGWRIDYQMATPGLAKLATTARVDRAAEYGKRWSDHAPLVIDYELLTN